MKMTKLKLNRDDTTGKIDNVNYCESENPTKKRRLNNSNSNQLAEVVEIEKPNVQSSSPEQKTDRKSITEEDYIKLKKYLKEKKKLLKSFPRVVLNKRGQQSQLNEDGKSESPLKITELNELLLYSIYGPGKYVPRWSSLEMQCNIVQTCILVIDGCDIKTSDDYLNFKNSFSIFSKYNFVPPLEIELPPSWCRKNEKELDSKYETDSCNTTKSKELCTKMTLLMSLNQLIIHNYPLPINKRECSMEGFRFTQNKYLPVSNQSPMFAVDCEMCYTSIGKNELTRVSIVDEKLNVIYESLVKPSNKITNYLTQYSGITPAKLNGVTTTLKDVQEDVIKLLPADAILIGQSLNCDLDALKLFHPYIIDTSVIYNLNGNKGSKSKLKHLAKSFLNLNIQCGNQGHCSVEDSQAAMLLVQQKLEKPLSYGDAYLIGQKRLAEFINSPVHLKNIDSFKKFLVLLKCITESPAQGQVHVKKQFMEAYDGIWSTKQFVVNEHSTNKAVLDGVCNSMNDTTNRFCMAHMQLKNKKNLDLVNRWCEKYWASMSTFGLCVVLFTGCGVNAENSVCLLNVKQPPLPILNKDW
ncbi:uncharacterized protein LOC126842283 [Adelges cooleyi]|uniref:uncharacterized protein LOC126842283 n=1 Tax=Adelges cooleyi TaxID=133065 RepID=UPI002180911E|nr:uncharacterized protein LOC126842283 [Adelges cooleyi]